MSPIEALFVDKGGVLLDNTVLSAQWRRLVGEFLAPRLGGSREAWGAANVPAFEREWARFLAAASAGGPPDIRGFFANDRRQWFLDMCDGVGVARPPDDVAEVIAADTVRYVRAHLDIPVPRVLDALRALRGRGIVLHIASADAHDELVEFLERIGARELFDRVYGSDLVTPGSSGPRTTGWCSPTAASIRRARLSSMTRRRRSGGRANADCAASSSNAKTARDLTTRSDERSKRSRGRSTNARQRRHVRPP